MAQFGKIDFRTRFPALDGLRALAVLLVFVSHYGGGLHGNWFMRILGHLRERGWIGVDLFFVLSGFLITGILYDTRNDSRYFQRFYARRSLRIFPVFYATAAVLLALTPLLRLHWRPVHAWFLLYLGNLVDIHDFSHYVVLSGWTPALSVFLGHLWSLCIEEQFYLVWPLIVFVARTRKRILAVASVLSLLELLGRSWVVLHVGYDQAQNLIFRSTLFRVDTLLMGAVLAMLLRGPRADRWQKACKWVLAASVGLALLLLRLFPNPGSRWLLSLGLSLTALMCAGLVGWVLDERTVAAHLFSRWSLRTLGRYSYGFYLFHLIFLNGWYWLMFGLGFLLHSLVLGAAAAVLLNFGLTLALARWSYHKIELPMLRRKQRFAYDAERRENRHAFELQP